MISKIFLYLIVVVFSHSLFNAEVFSVNSAQAQTSFPGVEATLKACKSLKLISTRDLCEDLAPGLSFNKVHACGTFSRFSSDVKDCLEISAYNQKLSASTIRYCGRQSFSSDKIECLEEFS